MEQEEEDEQQFGCWLIFVGEEEEPDQSCRCSPGSVSEALLCLSLESFGARGRGGGKEEGERGEERRADP